MTTMTMTPPEDDIVTTNRLLPSLPVLNLARLGTDDAVDDDNDDDDDDIATTNRILPLLPVLDIRSGIMPHTTIKCLKSHRLSALPYFFIPFIK